MSSDSSLAVKVEAAIQEWCSENGGGFPLGFVIALDYVNTNGDNALLISAPDGQPTHRSLGLATYLDLWFRDDAQNSWGSIWGSAADE